MVPSTSSLRSGSCRAELAVPDAASVGGRSRRGRDRALGGGADCRRGKAGSLSTGLSSKLSTGYLTERWNCATSTSPSCTRCWSTSPTPLRPRSLVVIDSAFRRPQCARGRRPASVVVRGGLVHARRSGRWVRDAERKACATTPSGSGAVHLDPWSPKGSANSRRLVAKPAPAVGADSIR